MKNYISGCCECGVEFRICKKCEFECPYCNDLGKIWHSIFIDEGEIVVCEHIYNESR
jgi:hypothetical protein